MRTARFVDLCFLYLGTLLFAHFALVAGVRFTVYALIPLLGSLTFFAFYLENRRAGRETSWPKAVVYLLALLCVAYTGLFVAGAWTTFR